MAIIRSASGALEPIEKASQDELRALQLTACAGSLRHAYENVPHYRQTFDARRRPPRRPGALDDLPASRS